MLEPRSSKLLIPDRQPPPILLAFLVIALISPTIYRRKRQDNMAGDNDKPSIPAWQKAASQSNKREELDRTGDDLAAAEESASAGLPSFDFKEVDKLKPVPTREEARKFLEHPGTEDAELEDKIRFLEMKNVKKEDIEAILSGAKKFLEDVSA
jgi:hypothetical protein